MRHFVLVVIVVYGLNPIFGQTIEVSQKFKLPNTLSESSGAIFFNDKLITITDSGGENKLYELDTISGTITRTVTVVNATNTDWEALTQDDTSIFIGDIGNNSGDRTDLKVHKISKVDYLNSTDIIAETIDFSYADQSDFTANLNNTEWDAEALVSNSDTHLILFTKDWVNNITKGYLIPKTPGTFAVNPLNSTLESDGLITGGFFNDTSGKLYLVGYSNLLVPFIWTSESFNGNDVFSGTNTKSALDVGQEQIEGIAFVSANRYLMTSESFSVTRLGITFSDDAKLMAFSIDEGALSNSNFENNESIKLFPNPVVEVLYVNGEGIVSVELFDTKSVLLSKGNQAQIDMSNMASGVYLVKINFMNQSSIVKRVVKR
ncbi:T9SS type A sorting domain-containing protein [Hyunsoonleella sp. SJ7]|uniref:T9SS type A sorting domain-containing protein n=1 Tax=Hyunsoonleella aquatilis TaxID=2762758 RepID=A0A923HC53_9FLAO|nr:T9SS type A sorting domain-containing protein [Hyunsoonleella aquatilis]MBC3759859.1 T9SS type A sorting domain-containing protein [Hyunsoonleella aquatilis]